MAVESENAPRPRRSWPQRLVLGLGITLTVVCLASAVGVAWGGWKFSQVERYDLALPDVEAGEPANFLIVGSDSRENVSPDDPGSGAFLDGAPGGRRSDTILVVRVDPEAESAVMLSLPRDLWVPIAGTGENQRINSAYGKGKQVLADTIGEYLGIPINHYVEVDFKGFQGLVSAVGGVPMYFERAMKDTNSGLDVLHPGCITLDGPSALAFVRSRHLEYMLDGVYRTDPTGDLGRITRQQLFVRRAISKAVSSGLSNPLTLKRLVDIGVENVGIDDRLSASALMTLGQRFQSFTGDQLETLTLPTTGFTTDGGASVLALDEAGSVPILDRFRPESTKGQVPGGEQVVSTAPVQVSSESDVTVRVLNGAGIDKRAANVAGALQQLGFRIDELGDVDVIGGSDTDRSEIHFQPADRPAAELLVRHLGAGADLVEDTAMEAGVVTLVVGRDFTAVTAELSAPPVSEPQDPTATTATTAPPATVTTTTEPPGRTPGDVPPGVEC